MYIIFTDGEIRTREAFAPDLEAGFFDHLNTSVVMCINKKLPCTGIEPVLCFHSGP